ncbi:hypothetical protein D1AOALGA4SA_11687, partial [Olavius algarvensis Delta 1 endosymbiont]
GMRILDLRYSVHFKLIERSDSTIRQSTFDIRHFNVVSYEVSGVSTKRFPSLLNPDWVENPQQ